MFLWICLIALIVFFIYWWGVNTSFSSTGGSGCNTCAKRKNNHPIE